MKKFGFLSTLKQAIKHRAVKKTVLGTNRCRKQPSANNSLIVFLEMTVKSFANITIEAGLYFLLMHENVYRRRSPAKKCSLLPPPS